MVNEYVPVIDPEKFDSLTGREEWHALYTIQLGELIETGVFDWSRSELDWSNAAYSEEQYKRVCAYFIERYRYDEISILPVKQWMYQLHRRLVYELMPKYKWLYKRVDDGINPFQMSDEYHKRREIGSDYPETLLSANADYISNGKDLEYETLKEQAIASMVVDYARLYQDVDKLMLDDLETMFVQIFTSNVNGL